VLLSYAYTFTDKSLSLGTSFPSFYQTTTRYLLESLSPVTRETVRDLSQSAPQNNVVLVVDESIRGDHLDINGYSRQTTPFLSHLSATEPGFHNFGLAIAGATCSYPSNALLLTGVRPGIDDFEKVKNYPTLFQYAKAKGYRTIYIDAQTNSIWNGLTDHDIQFIDSWVKASDLNDSIQSDQIAADRIREMVATSTGNFVVINKRGVHFLYESSYPKETAIWLPLPTNYAVHPDLVRNSYDNGIRYNLNTFFGKLLSNPQILENTVILYTSDHGQTLFEDGTNWLHCNYTPQEARVPLILIGRNIPPVKDGYVASHSNILPTLLDLMNVPREARVHDYAPSLFTATPEMNSDHFFFDGALRLIRLSANDLKSN
jgi:glucan phosphoethanolaminetransferase (alkaline phosphatase superfamily)